MKSKFFLFLSAVILMTVAACNNNNNNNNSNNVCCDDAIFFYGTQDSTYGVYPVNVITPNHDGFNEVLFLHKRYDTSQVYRLEIFDASNNSIFIDTNYHNDWSGKDKNGQQLADGKYHYEIHYGNGSVEAFVCIITSKISASSLGTCRPWDPGDPLLQ